MKYSTLLALVIGLAPMTAAAQITEGWSGEASLTGSKTTGNTETTDIGLGLRLNKESKTWRHKFDAAFDLGRVSGTTNKQRLALGYQIDRNLTDRLYAYGNADYFQDDFGAFQQGYFLGTGLGYKAIVPEPIGWDLEGGIGFRSQDEQDPSTVTTEEVALRGASDFNYQFNENVSLYNKTEILWSSSDTYIWNEIGVTAQLLGNLAARASFRIDTHSDVPVGTEKTDTITRVGVVYTIQ